MKLTVTEWSLEMQSRDQLDEKHNPDPDIAVREVMIDVPELNQFFYRAVGGYWYWIDRLDWTYQQWADLVERDEYRTWIIYYKDSPAGYFELEMQPDGSVEVLCIGLLPQFIGKGLGSHLLTRCVEEAWDWGASRVWLHTCTKDHERALDNYKARGFEVFSTREFVEEVPDQQPGPWEGSGKHTF